MVRLFTFLAFLLSLATNAQDLKHTLNLAGQELEKSANRRNAAIGVALATGVLCVAVSKAQDEPMPVLVIGGCGAVACFSLNISANNKQKKAGKLLQY